MGSLHGRSQSRSHQQGKGIALPRPRYVAASATWESNYVKAWLGLRYPCRRPGREKFKRHRWAVCLQGKDGKLSYPPGWYGNLFLFYREALAAISFLETVGGTLEEYRIWKKTS